MVHSPPDDGMRLLIAGSSTRAAAQSARRAGLSPVCIDAYADYDLQQMAAVRCVADFPRGVPAAARESPTLPWMYTGGLENHPRVIDALNFRHRLLGNGPDMLARIRDPWWVAGCLQAAELPVIELRSREETAPPADGRWLRKPLAGAGGRGIRVWDEAARAAQGESDAWYFQRLATGYPYSAQFVAYPGQTWLAGVTRQLVGLRGVHAGPFAWCGTVTPVQLPAAAVETMRRIGCQLAAQARLQGAFGCDFVVEGETPWLTEVNPRYTSAMEVVEFRRQFSLVQRHVEACLAFGLHDFGGPGAPLPQFKFDPSDVSPGGDHSELTQPEGCGGGPVCLSPGRVLGKLVLFADREFVCTDARTLLAGTCVDGMPFVADLPHPGQPIPAGAPICTVFSYDRTEEACMARLLRTAKLMRRRIGG